jgi:O-methyltransferase
VFASKDMSAEAVLTRPPYSIRRAIRERRDLRACAAFVLNHALSISFSDRLRIVKELYAASFAIDSPHRQEEMLAFMRTILSLPPSTPSVVVEAGAYKGSSTAKFSLAAAFAGRELVVFDSFQGLPDNNEPHDRNIFGRPEKFAEGSYCGSIDEVKANVARFGRPEVCRFVPGWFEETMPNFRKSIAAIYMDVDLAASTRTCLKYLYPLLMNGGTLYSQDGHLPLVIDVFADTEFWRNEVGCQKPPIVGLGEKKLIWITKEAKNHAESLPVSC